MTPSINVLLRNAPRTRPTAITLSQPRTLLPLLTPTTTTTTTTTTRELSDSSRQDPNQNQSQKDSNNPESNNKADAANKPGEPSSSQEQGQTKSTAQADKEVHERMEQMSGGGGEAGLELEDGKPVTMKRSVRNNMFRYI